MKLHQTEQQGQLIINATRNVLSDACTYRCLDRCLYVCVDVCIVHVCVNEVIIPSAWGGGGGERQRAHTDQVYPRVVFSLVFPLL